MSTPSFIDRLRSRSRRAVVPALLETSPPPLGAASAALLPEDHWHAGDPRLPTGAVGPAGADLPSPRRPVDRRGLSVVPEVDLRPEVVDLRAAAAPPATRASGAGWTEPSTWLG